MGHSYAPRGSCVNVCRKRCHVRARGGPPVRHAPPPFSFPLPGILWYTYALTAASILTRSPAHGRAHGGSTMTFAEVLDQAMAMLQQRGRLTYRTLKLHFQLDDEHLE